MEVGALQVGTMVLRAAASGAWVLATLSLHRMGQALPWRQMSVAWAVLALASVAGILVGLPILAWGHQLDPAQLEPSTYMAAACAPATMAAMLVLPIGAARRLPCTLRYIAVGLVVSVVAGTGLSRGLGVSGCVLAAGLGQLVTGVGVMLGLWSQRGQVGPSAGVPGVGPGGLSGEGTPADELGTVESDQTADAGDELGRPSLRL